MQSATPQASTHDVVIEIPKDSRIKYELEEPPTNDAMSEDSNTATTGSSTTSSDSGLPTDRLLRVDRILPCSMAYPGNYGYIPNTLAEDGDEVDVLMLCEEPLMPTCVVACRLLGYLEMTDSKGRDIKLIAVPATSVAQGLYDEYKNVGDLPVALLKRVQHFFEHYKQLDTTCWSKVGGYYNAAEAEAMVARYRAAWDS